MDQRLPSQIYFIGYGLLWLVLALALFMMPKALALSPGDFGAGALEQRFERAAGLDALGASGLPELRVWVHGPATPGAVEGVVVTPSGIARYRLLEAQGWGRRYDVAGHVSEASPAARQALRLLPALAGRDGGYLVCGRADLRLSVSGYAEGRAFHFHEAGDCSGKRPASLERAIGLIRPEG